MILCQSHSVTDERCSCLSLNYEARTVWCIQGIMGINWNCGFIFSCKKKKKKNEFGWPFKDGRFRIDGGIVQGSFSVKILRQDSFMSASQRKYWGKEESRIQQKQRWRTTGGEGGEVSGVELKNPWRESICVCSLSSVLFLLSPLLFWLFILVAASKCGQPASLCLVISTSSLRSFHGSWSFWIFLLQE